MALSDAQVSKQIEQMISFIQKESEEKIEEIETKVIIQNFTPVLNFAPRPMRNSRLKRVDW